MAIFGQISGRAGLYWPINITIKEEEHNSNHLKWFPVKTRDLILIKVSKTLIFAYFATFSAIFGQISRKTDLFWPFNTRRNEAEHNSNHLKSFQAISSWKNWTKTIFLKKLENFWKIFWGKILGHYKGENNWKIFFFIFMPKMT